MTVGLSIGAALLFVVLSWKTVAAWRAGRRWVIAFPIVAVFVTPIVWNVLDDSSVRRPLAVAAAACVVLCATGWAVAVWMLRLGAPADRRRRTDRRSKA